MPILRQLLFLLGCAAVATGVAMVYVPAGVVVAGLSVCLLALAAERDAVRRTALAEAQAERDEVTL